MTDQFAQTIIPWLGGLLGVLFVVSASLTVRFWRESKRSPYYFLRRQAEQNMQTYSLASIGLAVTLLFVGTYAVQGPEDNIMPVALMTNAKPVAAVETEIVTAGAVVEEEVVAEPLPEVVVLRGANLNVATQIGANTLSGQSPLLFATAETNATDDDTDILASATSGIEANLNREPALPPEFNQYEAEVSLADATALTSLSFSTEVDEEWQPVSPQRLFKEGFFTIYATFEYAEMRDGMAWSWVWRKDGEIISGGNELWVYGDEGPGYVYLNPQEGFQPGQYAVEIWVNGELMTTSNLFVTTNVAANN